jgi:threonine/homoserine/homoserine lactone efflux protein
MNIHLLGLHVAAVFLAMIAPEPDMLFVLAAGLAALFAEAPTASTALRLCGAAYLLFLGVQALRSARRGSPLPAAAPDRGLGHVSLQFAVLGAIFIAFEILIDGTVGLTAGRLSRWLSRRRRARQALDAGAGTIMIGLAGRLVLER